MTTRRALLLALAAAPLAATPTLASAPRKKGGGKSYTQFRTLTASIVRANGRPGVLTVESGVDAPDPAVAERVAASTPRLMDAYLTSLRTYAAGLRPGAPPDADFIGRTLQRDTDRVLGRAGGRLLLGAILLN